MLQIPRKRGHRQVFYFFIIVLLLAIATGVYFIARGIKKNMEQRPSPEERAEQKLQEEEEKAEQERLESGQPLYGTIIDGEKYIHFTGEEFKNLYDHYIYEHVTVATSAPSITGNAEADNHIRAIAEERGYKLRPVADEGFLRAFLGQKLQGSITEDLAALQSAGKEVVGIDFVFASGFRPVERQRELFLGKLVDVSHADIIAGKADVKINEILITRSIPGYSKHHTGYTVDFGCGNHNLDYSFADTECFAWLAENNYENAKRFGFIPSYPEGSGKQGPDPEPWEYVWVGEEALLAAPYQNNDR